MFVAMSTVGGWTMGYYDGSQFRSCGSGRSEYTLADNFFMGAFGGSYLNHQWLICACTPVFADAPAVDAARSSTRDGQLKKRPGSPLGASTGRCRSSARRRPGHARRLSR